MKKSTSYIVLLFIILLWNTPYGFGQQTRAISLEQALNEAVENNLLVKSGNLQAKAQRQLVGTSIDLPKTNISLTNGQYNTAYHDNNVTISQTFAFPTAYASQKQYLIQQANFADQQTEVTKNELKYQVKQLYFQIQYLYAKANLLQQQDSIYAAFARAGSLRYKTGESNLLEKATAETQLLEIRNAIQQNDAEIAISEAKLKTLINSPEPVTITKISFSKREYNEIADTSYIKQNPTIGLYTKNVLVNTAFTKTEKSRRLPDINLGYFNQSLTGFQNINGTDRYFSASKRFQGFSVGIAVPIWLKADNARINVANINEKVAAQHLAYYQMLIGNDYNNALQELKKCERTLLFYEQTALKQADLIFNNAQKAFKSGAADYIEYSMALTKVLSIQNNHLNEILQYNLAVIKLEYYTGQ
jgi:cobalt-zinc-cadmium resistance protein CzcA